MSGGTPTIVARSHLVRKCADLLERRRVEPLRRQPAKRPGSATATLDPFTHPFALRCEARERRFDVLCRQAFLLQGVSDGGVPEAAAGEGEGLRRGETAVVDEPGPLERRESLGARVLTGTALDEPLLEAAAGEIPVAECAD